MYCIVRYFNNETEFENLEIGLRRKINSNSLVVPVGKILVTARLFFIVCSDFY